METKMTTQLYRIVPDGSPFTVVFEGALTECNRYGRARGLERNRNRIDIVQLVDGAGDYYNLIKSPPVSPAPQGSTKAQS